MSFSDSKAIAGYEENATRRVPGLRDIHRMTALLMAESTPTDGRVLVVGAGGGMELKHFAQTYPNWRMDGVDPSAEMLKLANTALGSLSSHVHLHNGYVDVAPKGPFDAACCLLTLHFTDEVERYRTLCEIHTRLKSGGVFVAMHYSMTQNPAERELCLSRCAAFAASSGIDLEQAAHRWMPLASNCPSFRQSKMKNLYKKQVSQTSIRFIQA